MQLRYFCTGNVVSIDADDHIDEAIRLFETHQVRHLPVVRGNTPVGMVSEGNVLLKVGGLLSAERVSTQDPTVPFAGPTVVAEIMTEEIVALPPSEPIVEAAKLMLKRRIAAVVVVGHGRVMGIVSERDYLGRFFDETSLLKGCADEPVSDHMSCDVVATSPTTDAFTLLRTMGGRMHHLPVVEGGKLVGILSDRDVRRALALDKVANIQNPGQPVQLMADFNAARIMHRDVITTGPNVTLAEAAQLMLENKVGSIPVLDGDKLIGIITETDVLQACVTALAT